MSRVVPSTDGHVLPWLVSVSDMINHQDQCEHENQILFVPMNTGHVHCSQCPVSAVSETSYMAVMLECILFIRSPEALWYVVKPVL